MGLQQFLQMNLCLQSKSSRGGNELHNTGAA